ncbi:ABC transporter permease subunit [Bacillus carboniphilus]|uniref:ABC transporter permease subunit n=1 Tax=Bacillus carboniphilus TaxID=86663 RepID=A0ABY9JRL8_9BACI|nr:ABC transporter permease subunit [Bacillus carboniphilus]WLR41378.1 ABC transporter permease subunit [Bacillus carboniphilus]
MNIILKELRADLKSLIIWSVGFVFMIVAGMSKFSAFSSSDQSVNEFFQTMPETLQAIMGTGTFDLSTALGFYGVLTLYLLIMATTHATMFGANIVAKEERDQTAEFLFVKPISRNKVIVFKIVAALINVVVINLITFLTSFFVVRYFSESDPVGNDISLFMLGLFIVQVIFLLIGSSVAAIIRKPAKAAMVSAVILLVMFLLSIVKELNDSIAWLKYVTPFKYFEAKQVMYGGGVRRDLPHNICSYHYDFSSGYVYFL